MSSVLVVDVTRGDEVESRHEVDLVAVDSDGTPLWSRGDARRPVFPRSALKPVQSLPLARAITDGLEGVDDARLAIACGSHGGEPEHVALVDEWLADLGLGPTDLECGPHAPTHQPSAAALIREGVTPDARHNTCSGKHVGFLALCRHLGIDHRGYLGVDHPLQRAHISPAIEACCGVSLTGATPAIDGCGIPVWSIPLDRLAAGWARLAAQEAGRRVFGAMTSAPFAVAGSGRLCTALMTTGAGRIAVKTGAEGVFCGVDLETGTAVALKARDGATRAAEAAIEWAMAELGVAPPPPARVLHNANGTEVGSIRVAV